MANYDNNNSGALFINDRKEKDTHPDFKGDVTINGVQYWVSAWKKTSQNGKRFMSLSFQPKEKPEDLPGEGDEFDF